MKHPLLPPGNRVPENVEGPRIEFRSYHVGTWGPERDGHGPSTEVHLTLDVGAAIPPLVLRFKSARALETMRAALARHGNDVWPEGLR